jgi:DnaD/phage-associated family protein
MATLREGIFMKDIRLHTDSKSTATSVPNTFIDNYMADANGEFVKIYLYLLRCMSYGDNFSIIGMADKFENTEKDIFRALKYWEKLRILRLEYDEGGQLTGICLSDSSAPDSLTPPPDKPLTDNAGDLAAYAAIDGNSADAAADAAVPVYHAPANSASVSEEKRPEYTREQLDSFQKDEDVQNLMFIAEKYMGRTLNPTDINAILYWHDTLRFSIELIEYLIEYCVDKGHRTIRYMNKVALAWADSKFTTVEQAKKASRIHSQTSYAIMKAFGISGRNLVEFEADFIEKWTNQYGFSLDIISEACKRTIQATNQPNFKYADGILGNWKKNNVHHLEDIAALDAAFQETKSNAAKTSGARTVARTAPSGKNRFTSYPQRSYDYTELEKQLLNRSMQ